MDPSIDRRSLRARIRKESQEKAPEMLLKPLDGALPYCPLVHTILLDSWFVSLPSSGNAHPEGLPSCVC